MFIPPYEVLRGRVSSAEIHKGALKFLLGGRSITIDGLGGGLRRPFTDGDEIEVVVRRGIFLRDFSVAYAYRVVGSPEIRSAPRWRSLVLFVPGAAFLGFMFVGVTFLGFRIGVPQLEGFAAGAMLFLWGGHGLLSHAAATKILAATRNTSLERTRER